MRATTTDDLLRHGRTEPPTTTKTATTGDHVDEIIDNINEAVEREESAAHDAGLGDDEPPTCILTGADGEDPDDCTTHDHEQSLDDNARDSALSNLATLADKFGYQTVRDMLATLERNDLTVGNDEQPSDPAELSQHTPTPWRLVRRPHGTTIIGADSSEILPPILAPEEELYTEDLQLIVRCVNSHATLVAALEKARQDIHNMIWHRRVSGRVRERLDQIATELGDALKQARGGE